MKSWRKGWEDAYFFTLRKIRRIDRRSFKLLLGIKSQKKPKDITEPEGQLLASVL